MYSDEYIDYWGDFFCAMNIRKHFNVDFIDFLKSENKELITMEKNK